MFDNLNASGVYDGSTVDRTSVLNIYLPGFWIGNRAGITLATDRNIETDQIILVAKNRMDFISPYTATAAGSEHASVIYNLKTTL